MYYKLSNIAEGRVLEEEFGISLKYPNLYRPNQIINGLNEETLFVVASDQKNLISPAIWGLLPEEFVDDWSVFQNTSNTLNFDQSNFYEDSWCGRAFTHRRCLVIVTGFFTAFLHNGTIYPYHVKRIDGKPFCIAGIYNRLEDGFLTCSILTTKANRFTKKIQNIGSQMPLLLPKSKWIDWLNTDLAHSNVNEMFQNVSDNGLEAHLIAKEFFNHNITYDSVLEPVSYKGLPEVLKA